MNKLDALVGQGIWPCPQYKTDLFAYLNFWDICCTLFRINTSQNDMGDIYKIYEIF